VLSSAGWHGRYSFAHCLLFKGVYVCACVRVWCVCKRMCACVCACSESRNRQNPITNCFERASLSIPPRQAANPCDAAHCSTLQHTALHCNTLQYTTTHYNKLQHIAAHQITESNYPAVRACRTHPPLRVLQTHSRKRVCGCYD